MRMGQHPHHRLGEKSIFGQFHACSQRATIDEDQIGYPAEGAGPGKRPEARVEDFLVSR